MPLMKCTKNGKSGWKYGDSGACYTGPKGKLQAVKQGLAEHKGKWVDSMVACGLYDEVDEEVCDLLGELSVSDKYEISVAKYISKKTRDSLDSSSFGEPATKKFPIRNQKDLDSAVHLIGRSKTGNPEAIKKRIIDIAHRLGLKLPKAWSA